MSLQIRGAGAGQGIFGWWSAEEVICSRGGPGTSNHGKDKKGLHPFACWSTCDLFQARSGCSVVQQLDV